MNKKRILSLTLSLLLLMPGAAYAKENKNNQGKSSAEQKVVETKKATEKVEVKDSKSTAEKAKEKVQEKKQEAEQNRDEKKAQIEAFKTSMKTKHEQMKAIRQETKVLRQQIEKKTEQLSVIINDLQSGKKTLPEDLLNSLLAIAQNLKLDGEELKLTAVISTEASETQARVKGADFNNALASMDKVITKYQKRLDALKQLNADLDDALKIANLATIPAPSQEETQPEAETPTDTTTSETPTASQDSNKTTGEQAAEVTNN
jgi:hypothetical protein